MAGYLKDTCFGNSSDNWEKSEVSLYLDMEEILELNLFLLNSKGTEMTTIDDVFGGTTLKASDLQGKTVPVTIEGFEVREFDDGKKVVLSFVGKEKLLVCNKTNARTIGDQCGEHLEEWIGKKISLFPTQTDFQGKQVACIRVLMPTAQPATPQPDPVNDEIPF